MDLLVHLSVLVICFIGSDAGGHGGKHHVHVKIHLPEFIHHDHHKKVITIHHHHHKPKKEHHKPHIPHISPVPPHHHYHHHKKSTTHSVSKDSNHNHGHTHHSNHGHHRHLGHHGHQHDTPIAYEPAVNYAPPVTNYDPPTYDYTPPSYDHDYSYKSIPNIPDTRVHGVVHTVKQVKVFDSLPNAVPSVGNGYEVTEEGNEDEFFTSVKSHENVPAHGYLNYAPDSFSDISQQSPVQLKHNPFENAIQPTSYANLEQFIADKEVSQSGSTGVESSENDEPGYDYFTNSIGDIGSRALISSSGSHDVPMSYTGQGAIPETFNTEGFQTGYGNR